MGVPRLSKAAPPAPTPGVLDRVARAFFWIWGLSIVGWMVIGGDPSPALTVENRTAQKVKVYLAGREATTYAGTVLPGTSERYVSGVITSSDPQVELRWPETGERREVLRHELEPIRTGKGRQWRLVVAPRAGSG